MSGVRWRRQRRGPRVCLWIPSFNHTAKPPAGCKRTGDFGPDGSTGLGDILKNSIHGVFVKNADVPVGMDIHLERFELETVLVRHVVDSNGAEIGQACFGANGRVFRNFNRDLISLVLIREGLDSRQGSRNAALRMPFVVPEFRFLFPTAHFLHSPNRLVGMPINARVQWPPSLIEESD